MNNVLKLNNVRVTQFLQESDLSNGGAWYPLIGMIQPDLFESNDLNATESK